MICTQIVYHVGALCLFMCTLNFRQGLTPIVSFQQALDFPIVWVSTVIATGFSSTGQNHLNSNPLVFLC